MPGGFSALDTSFPALEGKSTEDQVRALTDYLFQLLEALRYTLRNLGVENMNEQAVKDLAELTAKAVKITAPEIDLTGYVTFSSLSEPGETVIDGANITSGTINAERLNLTGEISFGDLDNNLKGMIGQGEGGFSVGILATNGNLFRGSQGTTRLIARVLDGKTDADPGGTRFSYSWARYLPNADGTRTVDSSFTDPHTRACDVSAADVAQNAGGNALYEVTVTIPEEEEA